MADANRTCFVVMGFGKKTDFESGRTYDLDAAYRNMIKPAVEAAGLRCVRADEIVSSGLIDVPMYDQLLNADVVVADLSTSNKNAFYELGIRHALRPYTTVVIAEDGMKAPFDVNHVVIRQYHHLGEDIGVTEATRFRQVLTGAISKILTDPPADRVDSPVYRFVQGLVPPGLPSAAKLSSVPTAPSMSEAPGATAVATHSALMQQVDEAVKRSDFITAKSLMVAVRNLMKAEAPSRPEEPYILQRLALLTYKSKHPTEEAALKEATELLAGLEPDTSNDTETLGLWGAVHKRLWNLTSGKPHLDGAVRAHERGFYLRNDYYNGINLAFLLNVRAANASDPAEAIADFVVARRVRKEVIEICQQWLRDNPAAPAPASGAEARQAAEKRYWVLATLGEAMLGIGDPAARKQLDEAYMAAPENWMKETTQAQIARLEGLLANSPLERIG